MLIKKMMSVMSVLFILQYESGVDIVDIGDNLPASLSMLGHL